MTSRNEKCFCGSGLKYKKCCLPKEESERNKNIQYQHDKPKNITPDFKKVSPDEITAEQRMEVQKRIVDGAKSMGLYVPEFGQKRSWWEKLLSKIFLCGHLFQQKK